MSFPNKKNTTKNYDAQLKSFNGIHFGLQSSRPKPESCYPKFQFLVKSPEETNTEKIIISDCK